MNYRILLFLLLLACCCAQPPAQEPRSGMEQKTEQQGGAKAVRALYSTGHSDVRLHGHAWTGCAKEDSFWASYNFTARNNASDKTAKGVVCCGWGPFSKGCTIRYE